jgi:hypothetical protein
MGIRHLMAGYGASKVVSHQDFASPKRPYSILFIGKMMFVLKGIVKTACKAIRKCVSVQRFPKCGTKRGQVLPGKATLIISRIDTNPFACFGRYMDIGFNLAKLWGIVNTGDFTHEETNHMAMGAHLRRSCHGSYRVRCSG